MKEKLEDKLQELKDSGKTVYSFSRLGSFNNCEYEYYNTYAKGNRGIDNVYTLMGSLLHDNIEDIYSGKSDIDKLRSEYENKLMELDLLGITFPNESIGLSWKKDVGHFLKNFNKINSKMLLEKLIVFEVSDGIYMQGYIDSIKPSDKGKPYVEIIDWKTSSKFSGKKLNEAGRQLLMYKVGLEDNTPFKVDKIMWFMIKYVYVCNMQKNGKLKKKMCNRGKWVKEIRNPLEKELYKLNIDEFEVELLLDKATEDNSLDCLPKEVQEKFFLEDCFVEYDVTDEKIEELRQYVVDMVNVIESKDVNDKSDWKPVEINKQTSFYCSVLCGHRKHCEFYKKYLEENANGFEKKNKKDIFDIFS